jgi:hypothetical protein
LWTVNGGEAPALGTIAFEVMWILNAVSAIGSRGRHCTPTRDATLFIRTADTAICGLQGI